MDRKIRFVLKHRFRLSYICTSNYVILQNIILLTGTLLKNLPITVVSSFFVFLVITVFTVFTSIQVEASQTVVTRDNLMWDLSIAIIVLLTTLASAALPIAAIRQWPKKWRYSALFPLIILVLWLGLIGLSKAADSRSHMLWQFEIFSWAMLNMIYMVSLMTIKRILEKADEKNGVSD
jgi:hypothetical protein